MRTLTDAERAELYFRLWWSHDGQWFLKARDELGLERAMELNERSIESMGRIEMRELHRTLGAPEVTDAAGFLPMAAAVHELVGLPSKGEMDGPSAFTLGVHSCPVWPMTERAGLTESAPGCRGSLRRRLGWASVFFPVDSFRWTRTHGRPDGNPECGYRFELLST